MTQYNSLAQDYKEIVASSLMSWRTYIEAHTFFKVVGSLDNKSVLDLACGEGFYTRPIKQQGASLAVGIDIAGDLVAVAQAQEDETPLGIEYRVGDASQLQPDLLGKFDLVTAIYLLHYAQSREQLQQFCDRAFQYLRPDGGRFVTYVANPFFSFTKQQPQFLDKYGLQLINPAATSEADEANLPEGGICHLILKIGQDSTASFDYYYWNKATYEQSLIKAGFKNIAWTMPELSEEGKQNSPPGTFDEYLANPTGVILQGEE